MRAHLPAKQFPMPESASEILERLTAIGLVPGDMAREIAPEAAASDAAAFVDLLVLRGVLTSYQGHAALSGSFPLTLGEYVLLDRLGKLLPAPGPPPHDGKRPPGIATPP